MVGVASKDMSKPKMTELYRQQKYLKLARCDPTALCQEVALPCNTLVAMCRGFQNANHVAQVSGPNATPGHLNPHQAATEQLMPGHGLLPLQLQVCPIAWVHGECHGYRQPHRLCQRAFMAQLYDLPNSCCHVCVVIKHMWSPCTLAAFQARGFSSFSRCFSCLCLSACAGCTAA